MYPAGFAVLGLIALPVPTSLIPETAGLTGSEIGLVIGGGLISVATAIVVAKIYFRRAAAREIHTSGPDVLDDLVRAARSVVDAPTEGPPPAISQTSSTGQPPVQERRRTPVSTAPLSMEDAGVSGLMIAEVNGIELELGDVVDQMARSPELESIRKTVRDLQDPSSALGRNYWKQVERTLERDFVAQMSALATEHEQRVRDLRVRLTDAETRLSRLKKSVRDVHASHAAEIQAARDDTAQRIREQFLAAVSGSDPRQVASLIEFLDKVVPPPGR